MAKAVSSQPPPAISVPFTDLLCRVNQHLRSGWQRDWDASSTAKLYSVKPVLGEWESSLHTTRQVETSMCRLRLGHTYETHIHLLEDLLPPRCLACGDALTVKHVLVDCLRLQPTRLKHFHPTPNANLKQLLGKEAIVSPIAVLDFLKSVHFNIIYPGF